jgi:heat-inducible transcriptional repressor
MSDGPGFDISMLDTRSREIFRELVESYLESGTPVGSRSLSKRLAATLSPATIRNVMSDLEEAGLLFAPHTSAGRQPTDLGLRIFIDGLVEFGNLTETERTAIEVHCDQLGRSMEDMMTDASEMLSGLSGWAGVVMTPTADAPLKHIEFVSLNEGRALVIIVTENGSVENRIIEVPPGLLPSTLIEAGNYLNSRLRGKTLDEVRGVVLKELEERRAELDTLTSKVVEEGLATWGGGDDRPALIVRGRANLLEDASVAGDLERIRQLFADLENKQQLMTLLKEANEGHGVRVFIGAENQLFGLSGSSVIVAPYRNSQQRVVGALGVVGPTHLNYARVVPMVDYTAQVLGRML